MSNDSFPNVPSNDDPFPNVPQKTLLKIALFINAGLIAGIIIYYNIHDNIHSALLFGFISTAVIIISGLTIREKYEIYLENKGEEL